MRSHPGRSQRLGEAQRRTAWGILLAGCDAARPFAVIIRRASARVRATVPKATLTPTLCLGTKTPVRFGRLHPAPPLLRVKPVVPMTIGCCSDGAPGIGEARFRCRKIDHDGPGNLRVHDFGIRSGEASPMGQRVQPFRSLQYGRKRHALLFARLAMVVPMRPEVLHHDNRAPIFPPLPYSESCSRVFGRRRHHLIVRLQQS